MEEKIQRIKHVADFEPEHIFECGQCFRWSREPDGSYTGIALGRVINVSCPFDEKGQGRDLVLTNASEEDLEQIWKPYFDLGRDYGQIKKVLKAGDPVMARAVECGRGIRILRQDFWETLISFIISQNNNIPRIRLCIERLAKNFGTPAGRFRGKAYFNLPTPEVLAETSVQELRACGLGYRAPYLVETARQVMEAGGPDPVAKRLAGSDDPAAELEQFRGVGPKVANCIALFGIGRYDAFPIDVWVRRVMHQLYHIDEKDTKKMKAYAAGHFKEYGGFAQQYLFYYIRGQEHSAAASGEKNALSRPKKNTG